MWAWLLLYLLGQFQYADAQETVMKAGPLECLVQNAIVTLCKCADASTTCRTFISYNGTQVEQFSPFALINVTTLRHFRLRDNGLEEIEAGTFANPDLSSVEIIRNRLTYIDREAFVSKPGTTAKLSALQLSTNFLGDMSTLEWAELLQTLPQLTYIGLVGNGITEFPVDALPMTLKEIDIHTNRLHCCNLVRLLSKFDPWIIDLRTDLVCVDDDNKQRNVTALVSSVLEGVKSYYKDCDHCATMSCSEGASCINTGSAAVCLCNLGYELNDGTGACEDIDECELEIDTCEQRCVNALGSYKCACRRGSFLAPDNSSCIDCRPSPYCEANHTTCEGREGLSNCTLGHCLVGFENEDPKNNSPCVDINECLDNSTCGVKQGSGNECVNTYGSYRCICQVGFVGNGIKCIDLDECADPRLNKCAKMTNFKGQAVALCINTIGSYECQCNAGYQMTEDGIGCEDIDECSDPRLHQCSENAVCINIEGGYVCQCKEGFVESSKDRCRQCDSLMNCDLTLCGPYLAAEMADPAIMDYIKRAEGDSDNLGDGPGIPALPANNDSINNLRCFTCAAGYYKADAVGTECLPCRDERYCANVSSACTNMADTVCASCPPGMSGQTCEHETFNITQSMNFDTYTDDDANALRTGLLAVLGITQDTTPSPLQTVSWGPGSVITTMRGDEAAVGLLGTLVAENSPSIAQLNVTSMERVSGVLYITVVSDSNKRTVITVGLAVGMVLLGFLVLLVGIYIAYNRHASRKLTVEEIVENIKKKHKWTELNTEEAQRVLWRIQQQTGWLPRSQFFILERIGSGEFGDVLKAVLFSDGIATMCAAKKLKDTTAESRKQFLREAALLKELNHPNIVNFLGLCAEGDDPDSNPDDSGSGGNVYLLLEFMALGDLRDYLVSHSQRLSVRQRLWFAHQIAQGLAYLASKGVVHRDVAARNVLLSDPPPDRQGYPVVKLSDMGLARMTGGERQYVKEGTALLPLRWMAPESITENVYTEKSCLVGTLILLQNTSVSDVWAFGVTCWEIYSFGAMPYAEQRTHELLSVLEGGTRLLQPTGCPDAMFVLMKKTWEWNPADRPSSADVALELDGMLQEYSTKDDASNQSSYSTDAMHADVDQSQFFGAHIDMSDVEPLPRSGYAWLDEHTGKRKTLLASQYT